MCKKVMAFRGIISFAPTTHDIRHTHGTQTTVRVAKGRTLCARSQDRTHATRTVSRIVVYSR